MVTEKIVPKLAQNCEIPIFIFLKFQAYFSKYGGQIFLKFSGNVQGMNICRFENL